MCKELNTVEPECARISLFTAKQHVIVATLLVALIMASSIMPLYASYGGDSNSSDSVFARVPGIKLLTWTKHPGNPVISEGSRGSWDRWKSDPFVMKDGGVYKMWYGTTQDGTKAQIGYAESVDGVNWVHHPTPVVRVGKEGAWDDEDIETPTVVKRGGVYHLWYCGRGEPEGTDPITNPEKYPDACYRIGHATSEDGVNWVKDPQNPVVDLGTPYIDWDWLATAEPTVIVENGLFKMWYVGATIVSDRFYLQIGYATSADGTSWNKFAGNPVISSWKNNGITCPTVIHGKRYYELWYVVYSEETGLPAGPFKYAISLNGVKWVKLPGIALKKGSLPAWDWLGIFGPTVLLDGQRYKMWYSGFKIDLRGVHFAIGYATRE